MERKRKKLLIPKTDIVFQALFGTKGNERILEGFLTEILDSKVENISLDANQVLVREIPEDKLGILDLIANIGDKTTVNIEVQLINPYNMPERILYYWAKVYGSQIKSGESYNLLKKTISILIIDYELPELKTFKDAHTEWKLLEKRNTKVIVFKNLEIHILEIPKWIKNQNETKEGLGNWIEFLTNPESERVKMSAMKNIKLKEACEKLEYISENEQIRREIEFRRKIMMDERNRNRVLAEIKNKLDAEKSALDERANALDVEKGALAEKENALAEKKNKIDEEKNKIDEVRKKLVEGFLLINTPIEKIIEYTGLAKEEILEIKNKKE